MQELSFARQHIINLERVGFNDELVKQHECLKRLQQFQYLYDLGKKDQKDEYITIHCKPLKATMKPVLVSVPTLATVQELKAKLAAEFKVPADTFRIVNKGKAVTELTKRLAYYNINDNSVLIVQFLTKATPTDQTIRKTSVSLKTTHDKLISDFEVFLHDHFQLDYLDDNGLDSPVETLYKQEFMNLIK